jgi:hypothetical protein
LRLGHEVLREVVGFYRVRASTDFSPAQTAATQIMTLPAA